MTERYDDPILRMVVAAGTSPDLRHFWMAVAEILLLANRATRVVIEYSVRGGAGTVCAGGEGAAAPSRTETWQEGADRHVHVHISPPGPEGERLERELFTAVELATLVGRRAALEHERRIGTFLVELSRWMRTAASDPRQLLQYTVHSVMTLASGHGGLIVERGSDGDLELAAAVGATEGLQLGSESLRQSTFSRVMQTGEPLLTPQLGGEPDVRADPGMRATLAGAVLVPLATSGEAAGVLAVYRLADRPRGNEPFGLEDVAYLQAVGSHIGGALELAEAVRAARQAARRASAMVNGSPLPLALVAGSGHVVEANPALVSLFGFEDADRIVGEHLDAFPIVLDGATPDEALDLATSGVPWRGRARVIRASGERQCEAFLTPLGEEDGGEFLLAIHDRTEELRARRELVAREKLATVGTLAAGVAHEVNNPLAAIRMEAELLTLEGGHAPEVLAASRTIIQEVDRAARIAKSLLRLTTQAHGGTEEIDVGQMLSDLVTVRAPLLRETGITLRLDADANLPKVVARGGDLEQLFMHLFTNAEDAVRNCPRQVVEVRALALAHGLRVIVDDTGPGVDPDVRGRVFDPFYTTKAPDRGSGLGLAMSQRIVSELGGKIWVEDGGLGGARFLVELPGARTTT